VCCKNTLAPPWPDGCRFAFTVFDDTDNATLENVQPVYSFLADCGFRTTKSVWTVKGNPNEGFAAGDTCEDVDYLQWLLELQSKGFEIAWHNATWHGLPRERIAIALEAFKGHFGHYPFSGATHFRPEGLYWGDGRVSGFRKLLYNLLTRFRNHNLYRGHIEGDPYFWGDLCREKIKYYRNFVYNDINTLKLCPFMPYFDADRSYINNWFASSNGTGPERFVQCISEANQDRLEEEGGACIMYTHFGWRFSEGGRLGADFKSLLNRLSKKNGWFVPVTTLLDYLQKIHGPHQITANERRHLEWKWIWEKIFNGTD
jgi:hypothetical protein